MLSLRAVPPTIQGGPTRVEHMSTIRWPSEVSESIWVESVIQQRSSGRGGLAKLITTRAHLAERSIEPPTRVPLSIALSVSLPAPRMDQPT